MFKRNVNSIYEGFTNPLQFREGVEIGKDTDAKSYNVTTVFYRTPDYVVYEVNSTGDVEYMTVNDKLFQTQAISLQLNRINTYLCKSVKTDCFAQHADAIADAIAACLEQRPNDAITLASQLEADVKNELYRWSKLIYMSACILFAGIICLAGIICFVTDIFYMQVAGVEKIKLLVIMFSMASLGALFSITRNLDNYNVEVEWKGSIWKSFSGPHLVGVIVRMLIGVLGSLVVYLVLHLNLLNIPVAGDCSSAYTIYYLLAFLAGFSQDFVPGMLTRFEANINAGEPLRVKPSGEVVAPRPAGQLPMSDSISANSAAAQAAKNTNETKPAANEEEGAG